ncbi:TIGR02466 family protein [Pokkaliibacter sp. CJK22405]|uniref:TIGR02466 family protein n=1 Tax=Pokkaliibacter sp. CJK22405 TaxID=3384615 RepID=UPI0039852F33
MAFDLWFPLAVYHADLPGHEQQQQRFVEHIHALRDGAGQKKTSDESSWTGDVHTVDQIHRDSTFDWLTEQVELHTLFYLKQLGHNMDKVDLYIQRAWPIIARKNQAVAMHAHHTAHISAVYYVSVPKTDNPGQTRFFSDSKPNEVAPGIGANMTKGYSELNPFNFQCANYDPIPGRLLLFPAKQMHDVTPHTSDEERITISYDMVLAAKDIPGEGTPEFLMPSPARWSKVSRTLPEGV